MPRVSLERVARGFVGEQEDMGAEEDAVGPLTVDELALIDKLDHVATRQDRAELVRVLKEPLLLGLADE